MPRGEQDRPGGLSPQEKIRHAIQTLEEGVESVLTGEAFAGYLRVMAHFHTYSAGNVLLIHLQRPGATRVAGYQRWKELGRQVKRGEKGITILVPHKREVQAEDEEDERYLVSGFGVTSVFDISQTEGPPLPEPPRVVFVAGASDPGMRVYVDLLDYLEQQVISTAREDFHPANGYFDPFHRHAAIGTHIDGDQATKTLLHEVSHVVAGHTLDMNSPDIETVAESSAFVVLNYYGLDSSRYTFPYVAGWAKDRAVFKRNLDTVQRTAHTIIAGLEGKESRMTPSSREKG